MILRMAISNYKYNVSCGWSVTPFVCENVLLRELENKVCMRLSKVIVNLCEKGETYIYFVISNSDVS